MRLTEELRKRTKQYASAIIRLYVTLPMARKEVQVLGHELLRSGTSVAAQIREASRARSDAEFCSKLDSALQEADESAPWLELVRDDCGITAKAVTDLLTETNELMSIFVTIVNRTKGRRT